MSRFGRRPTAQDDVIDYTILMPPIHWLAVLAATVSTFLIGGLWYSPVLFAKRWQALNELSDDDLKRGNPARIFGGSFVLSLVAAINLAFFLGPTATFSWGLGAGALAGIGWVATAMGTTYLFEQKPLALFFIDAGYHAVSFTLMGGILGAWH